MRTIQQIEEEMKKVNTAKRNAECKRAKCIERLDELEKELILSQQSELDKLLEECGRV